MSEISDLLGAEDMKFVISQKDKFYATSCVKGIVTGELCARCKSLVNENKRTGI